MPAKHVDSIVNSVVPAMRRDELISRGARGGTIATDLEPVPYTTPLPPPPTGSRLRRGLAQLAHGHLPYVFAVPFDRLCNRLGRRLKTVDAEGFKIRVRRLTADEQFIYNILVNREYTPAPHYAIRATDTVIDIGGNIGVFSLLAGRDARRVLTYEPIRENFRLLERNLAVNGLRNVTPHRLAVVGTKRPIKIFTTPRGHEATGSHSMFPDMAGGETTFESPDTTTLPEIFETHRIERCHLLKIDCEGAEFEIFEQLPSAYFQRIDRIVMEYHVHTKDSREKRQQAAPLLRWLQHEGFHVDAYFDSVGFKSGFIRARRLVR